MSYVETSFIGDILDKFSVAVCVLLWSEIKSLKSEATRKLAPNQDYEMQNYWFKLRVKQQKLPIFHNGVNS